MELSELHNERVLLVLVSKAGGGRIQLALGVIRVAPEALELELSGSGESVRVDTSDARPSPLPVERLDEFVAPIPGREEVMRLATTVRWCVPVLLSTSPIHGLELLDSPFYGLIRTTDRAIVFVKPTVNDEENEEDQWGSGWEPDT